MAKEKTQKVKTIDGYIYVADGYYVKPCDAHTVTYDLYCLKPSTSPRHPEGKLDDMAYGITLERAIEHVIHEKAQSSGASTLEELIQEMKKLNKEIRETSQLFKK